MKDKSFREHRELGDITWLRDYSAALDSAMASKKPIVLLFQEVPGCTGCVNFGHDVLENPLLVELIETSFVPLAIFNNQKGRDAEILAKFNETAWNYPVVYILEPSGQPIVPKLSNRYDPIGLFEKLVSALDARGDNVPTFAQLLRSDLMVEYGLAKSATFETPCFWSGETSLAQHPAVLTTEAGWIGSEEVVRVNYDPDSPTAADLGDFASNEGFRRTTKTGFRSDKAPQYYLNKSPFARLPLSLAQRTRINLAIPYRDKPERFLSPRQAAILADPDTSRHGSPTTYQRPFREEWEKMRKTPITT